MIKKADYWEVGDGYGTYPCEGGDWVLSSDYDRLYEAYQELHNPVNKDKENKMTKKFDMKTMPWFIRANEHNFAAVQSWLVENYGKLLPFSAFTVNVLTNMNSQGVVEDRVMWSNNAECCLKHNCFEIKLTFKTVVESVEWPNVISEEDKKIEQLEESIRKAQEQLEELKKIKGSK